VQHGLAEQAFSLQTHSKYPIMSQHAAEYERLDQLKIEGLKFADRNCRKLPMGEVPWSLQLQVLRYQLGYWQLVCKKVAGRRISMRLIEHIRAKGQVSRRLLRDVTFGEASLEEKRAYKDYIVSKRAKARRQETHFWMNWQMQLQKRAALNTSPLSNRSKRVSIHDRPTDGFSGRSTTSNKALLRLWKCMMR
jgi:hypothetical protein